VLHPHDPKIAIKNRPCWWVNTLTCISYACVCRAISCKRTLNYSAPGASPASLFAGLASTASLAAILRPLGAGFSDTASSTSSKGTCRRPSVCPLCNRTFSNHFNMKQHIMNVHVPPVPAQCPKCNCTVRNRLYLRKHLVKAHNVPLRRVFDSQGRRVYVNNRNSSV
jgi:hypothetical protein